MQDFLSRLCKIQKIYVYKVLAYIQSKVQGSKVIISGCIVAWLAMVDPIGLKVNSCDPR